MAATRGRRSFPWRVLAIADRDAAPAETDVVWRLGGETAAGDWSWIRGGKSQSEWLWDNILYDVPFRSGYNTETYRQYISFAERFRTGYLFFDAGWSKVTDLFDLTKAIDVPGLVAEARSKDVGVVLWTSSLALSRQMDAALDRFRAWGVGGIMVDFMDPDDAARRRERAGDQDAARDRLPGEARRLPRRGARGQAQGDGLRPPRLQGGRPARQGAEGDEPAPHEAGGLRAALRHERHARRAHGGREGPDPERRFLLGHGLLRDEDPDGPLRRSSPRAAWPAGART